MSPTSLAAGYYSRTDLNSFFFICVLHLNPGSVCFTYFISFDMYLRQRIDNLKRATQL